MAEWLDEIAEAYPVTLLCVGMSLVSVEPLDLDYCHRMKKPGATRPGRLDIGTSLFHLTKWPFQS